MSRHYEKHGRTKTPEHRTWLKMIDRCHNPQSTAYYLYGARGIAVCPRWRSRFSSFLQDMGARPPGATLDRKDPDGDYTPANCRWATRKEQANNRRRHVLVTHNGKTQNIAAWASETGLGWNTIKARLEHGWSVKEALTLPSDQVVKLGSRGKLIEFRGEKRTLSAWARHLGIGWDCLHRRVHKYGWSLDRAFGEPVDISRRSKC